MVQFYSVKLGTSKITEFEFFDNKDFPNHYEELQIIYNVINEMRVRGAKEFFFKNERNAEALPIVSQAIQDANKEDFGLRLYCKRMSDELLIIFNGDIKTHINPNSCVNVCNHFTRAVRIGFYLDKAVFSKDIDIYHHTNPFEDFELDI